VAEDFIENREIYIDAPIEGPRRNFAKIFSVGKTRIIRLPYAEESISRFDTMPECDRQTDRQTDRIVVSVSRVIVAVLIHDKMLYDNINQRSK